MALFGILLKIRSFKNINIVCAHVNHKVRVESDMEEEIEQDNSEVETIHLQTCDCVECQEKRNKYVTILDIDKYIESLNDWD